MFQIFVLNKKRSSKKGTTIIFLKLFMNAMIRNIKIHNIIKVIKFSKFMKLNKYTH